MTLDRAVREALVELIDSEARTNELFDVVSVYLGRELSDDEKEKVDPIISVVTGDILRRRKPTP